MDAIEFDYDNAYMSINRNYWTNGIIVKIGEIEGEENLFFDVKKLDVKLLTPGKEDGGIITIKHKRYGNNDVSVFHYKYNLHLEHGIFNLDLQPLIIEKMELDILNSEDVKKLIEDFVERHK